MMRNSLSNACAGYHQFMGDGEHYDADESYGSFEVFWAAEGVNDAYNAPGWYWWSCYPGCLPDSNPFGPFPTSEAAYADAVS